MKSSTCMLWLGLMTLSAACNEIVEGACPPGSIVVGAVLDRTGTAATPSWASSIELAEAHINQALARSGSSTRFCVRFADMQNDVALGPQRAQELVAAGAKALLVQQAPVSLAINKLNYDGDTSNDLGVPLVCGNCVPPGFNNPTAMNPDPPTQAATRDANEWFFRTVMSNVHDAAILVEIATATANGDANGDGRFKVGVYTTSEPALASFRSAVKNQVTAKGVELGIETSVETMVQFMFAADVNNYDFGADLDRLADATNEDTAVADGPPDVLIQLSPPNVEIAAVKAYLQRGLTTRFLHTINFRNPAVISVLGGLADGQEGVSSVVLSDQPSGTRFAQDLQAATGAQPEIEDATYYDGAVLVMLAVLHAAQTAGLGPEIVTGSQVRDALSMLNDPAGQLVGSGNDLERGVERVMQGLEIDYDGASGPCNFTPTGNVTQQVVHYRVTNKQYVDIGAWDCRGLPDSMNCPRTR